MAEDGRLRRIREVVAFGLVGGVATVTYLAVTLGLGRLGTAPAAANVVGIAVLLAVSYLGHHGITFARVGDHGRYLVRFLATSGLLAGASTLGTWIATERAGVPAAWSALAVAVGYPPASYALNALWTFRDRA